MRILLAALCTLFFVSTALAATVLPDTIILSPQVLHETKQRILAHDPAVMPAYEKLINEANRAIDAKAESVILKKRTAPSGDQQDYWSLSPYWWPNPDTPNGLPYIYKEGERNREALTDDYDRMRLNRMSKNALTLALAYYLTGNETYAGKGTALIWAWCCDNTTRTNPHMLYAQSRPGVADGDHTGILETRDLIRVVDAARLLEPSRAWTSVVTRKLSRWFSEYTHWLMHSKFGREEAESPNNHGTWFDAQVAVFATYSGDLRLARAVVGSAERRRIVRQILPDGSMPLELERDRSRHYTFFNLEAFFVLCCVGEHIGIDLWNWADPVGQSIRQAFEFAAPGIDPRAEWPHGQTGRFDPYAYVPLFRRAALVYKEPRYLEFLKALPPEQLIRDRAQLFY